MMGFMADSSPQRRDVLQIDAMGWDWVDPIRAEHFAEPLLGRYRMEPTDEDTYWDIHESELRAHFPPEVLFAFDEIRTPEQRAARQRILDSTQAAPRLREYWIVRDGDRLVAVFSGGQYRDTIWEMFHTTVHPDYRRQGVYRAIIDLHLAYSAALGFDTVVSDHAPGNNPIVIAKLRAGFRILGLELDAAHGVSLRLVYFHNPDHLAAYEFRMGNAALNPRLVEAGFGAFDQLRDQLER